ncbi:MAG: ABC transporter substrate-binding protein [Acidimicrobiales bacterium]|nr:ABC transporter substrate-binding protein [Acidimicrobiales bacterium]
MKPTSKVLRLLAAMLSLALVAAACGDDDDSADGDTGGDDDTEQPSGGGEEVGVDRDAGTISLGVITPLTGPVSVIGLPLSKGAQVYWDSVNADGGIGGELMVELVTEDNEYNPQTTVDVYNRIKGDVAMFGQILGTPPTQAVLPQLSTDGILAAPASLDAEWVAEEYLIPVGTPYQIQAANGLTWWHESQSEGDDTYCAMIQDDPYGESGLEGMEAAAADLDVEIAEIARFAGSAEDVTAQVGQLSDAGCNVNLLVSTPSDTATIFAASAGAEYFPTWLGQSPSYVSALAGSPLAPYLEATFYQLSEGTEWGDPDTPGMVDMIADQEEFAPDQEPDTFFIFGYAQAKAVHAILEKALADDDLSREGIKAALEGIGEVAFDGIFGDYTYGAPADRVAPKSTTIFKFNPDSPAGLEKIDELTSPSAESFDF